MIAEATSPLLGTCDRCGRDPRSPLVRDALGYVCAPCHAGNPDNRARVYPKRGPLGERVDVVLRREIESPTTEQEAR